jgi:hypothetical protein
MSTFRIEEGDLVVHADYGVCRVLGVESLWDDENICIAKGETESRDVFGPSGVEMYWVHPSSLRPCVKAGDVVIDSKFGTCTVLSVGKEMHGDADTVCIRVAGGAAHWVHPTRLRSGAKAAPWHEPPAAKAGRKPVINGADELEIPLDRAQSATHVWG